MKVFVLHLHLGTIFVLLRLGFQPSYKIFLFQGSLKCQYINKLYCIVTQKYFSCNVHVMGGSAMHFHTFIFVMKLCQCIRLLSNDLPLINSLCCALALGAANRRR